MKLNTEHITKNSCYWNNVNELAKEAFPPEEYIAPAELEEMEKTDNFDFLALKDGDSFVGFMAVMTYENLAYLFFLAIDSACRSKGYGSRAIETLKAEYPGKKQVVDFEMLDEIFGFKQKDEQSVVAIALGYRAENDSNARRPKSRLPRERVIEFLR